MSPNNSRLFYQISSTISGPWMKNGVLDITGLHQQTNKQLWEFIATPHIHRWIYCCPSEFPTCRRCVVFFFILTEMNDFGDLEGLIWNLHRRVSQPGRPSKTIASPATDMSFRVPMVVAERERVGGTRTHIYLAIAAPIHPCLDSGSGVGMGAWPPEEHRGMKEKRLFISRCVTIYLLEVSFISSIKCCWLQVGFFSTQKQKVQGRS